MLRPGIPTEQTRDLLLRVLSVQASLAGFSIAAIGLIRFSTRSQSFSTFADDLLGLCALVFLVSTYLTFWALRTRSDARMQWLARWVDGLFLAGLTGLVTAGFMILYALT